MPVTLVHNSYGKSLVRLTKVTRHGDRHELKELAVAIQLEGEFTAAYTAGDKRLVVATDTMKNTVYALARQHPLTETDDSTFATIFQANRRYSSTSTGWNRAYQTTRQALQETFAGHKSLGVQQTTGTLRRQ